MSRFNGPECYKVRIGGQPADPYRILLAYGIAHPCQQHVIKKLLRAGKSHKSLREDVEEAMETLSRWLDIMDEDEA